MTTWYALCAGGGARICQSCARHVDHNPKAAAQPHQSTVQPAVSGGRCARWMAQRASAITPTDKR